MKSEFPQATPPNFPRARRHLGLLWIALPVMVGVIAFMGFSEFQWRDLPAVFMQLNVALLLTLMAVLPIVGFPITLVYLAAGVRFGPLLGGAVVAGVTAVHLLGTRWIARRFLREPLERSLGGRGYHLPEVPEGDEAGLAVMGVLVPGLPYFVRNYLLAIADIPLATFLAVCVPLYVARAYVVIFLGDLSQAPSSRGFALLGAIYALKLGACGWVLWRMRRHYLRRRAVPAGN